MNKLFFENLKLFILQDKFLSILANFTSIFPKSFVYVIFKNSYKIRNIITAQKTYNFLVSKKLCQKLENKLFISELVIYETENFTNKKNFILKENRLKLLKKLSQNIDNFFLDQGKIFFSSKIALNLNLIINEFLFLDCKSLAMLKYYKLQWKLQINNKKKNSKFVILDKWWFQAIGHVCYLDAFIKGIVMGMIRINKIYFEIKKKDICNQYLFNNYKNILKNYGLLGKKSSKYCYLNMRYWELNKPFVAAESEQVREYIQSEWLNSKYKFKNLFLNHELKYLNYIKKKLDLEDNFVTVHIRQKNFNSDSQQNNIRNSNINIVIDILSQIKTNLKFILLGSKNIKSIKTFNSKIIDYPNSSLKNDINDIIFLKNSKGHIGTTSGITHHFLTTDIPSLYINWSPFDYYLKNDRSIIMPKILKPKKKGHILSFQDYNKIVPALIYNGKDRLKYENLEIFDNSYDELYVAINKFIQSLEASTWKNYGVRHQIDKSNYDFHNIPNNLPSVVKKVREVIYFEPNFIKKYKNFLNISA